MSSEKCLKRLPPFDSLPRDHSGPHGNAWGLFGADDQLGMLNLLGPETVTSAARENILDGTRVSLDWALNQPAHPSFNRKPLKHEIVNRKDTDGKVFSKTESISWAIPMRRLKILKSSELMSGLNTEGLLDGGVLLDYASWAEKNLPSPLEPLKSTAIPLEHLKRIVQDHNITFRTGDILFIRGGFTKYYNSLCVREQDAICERESTDFIGLEAGLETLKWIWESEFAAVASDTPSFERAPINGPHADPDHMLHQWLIAGWGMPIGELFDLERLAQICEEKQRWTFFLSSVPLKVPGGVASPPNAVAIF